MPDVTLPELTPASAISDGDLIITRQGADTVDKRGTALQLKAYIGAASQNVFIQDTDPAIAGVYLWIDITGGNLNFWVEDGV